MAASENYSIRRHIPVVQSFWDWASVLHLEDEWIATAAACSGPIADAIPTHSNAQVIHTISDTPIAWKAENLCRGKRSMSVPPCGLWNPIGIVASSYNITLVIDAPSNIPHRGWT